MTKTAKPHKLFCYAPHKRQVLHFLHDVNPAFQNESLHAVSEARRLPVKGTINFLVPDGNILPLEMVKTLRVLDAVMINIGDYRLHAHAAPYSDPDPVPGGEVLSLKNVQAPLTFEEEAAMYATLHGPKESKCDHKRVALILGGTIVGAFAILWSLFYAASLGLI